MTVPMTVPPIAPEATQSPNIDSLTEKSTITLPPVRYAYAASLSHAEKTAFELSAEFGVSRGQAGKILKFLVESGVAKFAPATERWGSRVYSLAGGMDRVKLCATCRVAGELVSDEEICVAGELRRAGLVGEELTAAFQTRYPARSGKMLRNIVTRARRLGLCR
jgi:hypothetical protein